MRWRLRRALRRLVASSWTVSKLYYRLHGLRLEGRPDDPVWYFAYGANMYDGAFRDRQRMRPLEWRPGHVKGCRLRFNLEGRPVGKAAPANIAPDPEAEVWGVLYKITRKAAVRLDFSEGVPGPRYRHLWIEALDIDGHPIVPTFTYIAQGKSTDGRPSLRYLSLLRDGARAHNLPEHWLRFLDSVRHAE